MAVALIIGTIELLGLAVTKLGLKGAFWGWVSQIDINTLGYLIVAMFVATWALALLIWRVARIEERWGAQVREARQTLPRASRGCPTSDHPRRARRPAPRFGSRHWTPPHPAERR